MLGDKKSKSIIIPMMLKTGVEVAENWTVFNYGPPRPQKGVKFIDRKIMVETGVNLTSESVISGNNKGGIGK